MCRRVRGVPYVLWLIPGIVPWFYYSEALNCVTGCLQEYSYLVKKVVFQVEILPIIKLISCMLVHAFFAGIMLAVILMLRTLCPWLPGSRSVLQLCGSMLALALAI